MDAIIVSKKNWKQISEATLAKLELLANTANEKNLINNEFKTLSFHQVNYHILCMLDELKES